MPDERWRRGQSRDRLLASALHALAAGGPSDASGRAIARAAGVHAEQVQQMFGSVNALVTAALIAERNSFLAEAFGSTGLPDPLAIADYEQFWRAMVWAVLDSGPIDLTELTSGGSVVQLRARLAQANPDAAASTIDGITAAWAVTPLGALVFRGPLQRGFTIDDADWDWSWRRLRRRLNALVGGGHVGEPAPPIGTSEPPATPANTASRLRLIDAAGELLATRLEQGVSGRELAEHAGVNYGLVNHYFGSKDAVFDEALQQMHRRFLLDILHDDLSEPFALLRHRPFLRAWASRLLLGPPGPDFELVGMDQLHEHVRIRRGLDERDHEGSRGASADGMAAVALQLGWAIAQPLVSASLPASESEMLRELGRINSWLLRDP